MVTPDLQNWVDQIREKMSPQTDRIWLINLGLKWVAPDSQNWVDHIWVKIGRLRLTELG